MASTYTPNINLEEPARGDYVGTWDTPVNANETLTDLVLGGITTINVSGGSVVLTAAQFQCKTIIFGSTLLANVTITFPTSFKKSYELIHAATGSSAFTITCTSTTAGGNYIGLKPGDPCDVVYDGSSFRYKNLGMVGSYVDFAGSSVPNWITACALPPYLECSAVSFSSANYPALATILGGTTTPDARGRARFARDGGVGRLSSAIAGFDPNTVGSGGGNQNFQAHTHTISITDPGHTHTTANGTQDTITQGGGAAATILRFIGSGLSFLNNATTGISATAATAGSANSGNVPPAYIGGITMIRAG